MEPKKGYYSLVQFCPDRSRMESANIGVILCVPVVQYIRARMTTSHDRVRGFWRGNVDLGWLKTTEDSLQKRLDVAKASLAGLDEFRRFVATRANQIVLTEPRPVKVCEPDNDLDKLFSELVGHRERRTRREPVIPELDRAFRCASLAGRIRFNERVTVPIVGRTLEIPYVYQNGDVHLVKPISISERFVVQTVESVATEGNLLQRRSERSCRFIVVPDLSTQLSDNRQVTRRMLAELFGEYKIRTVWEDERPAFIQEVEREAHQL